MNEKIWDCVRILLVSLSIAAAYYLGWGSSPHTSLHTLHALTSYDSALQARQRHVPIIDPYTGQDLVDGVREWLPLNAISRFRVIEGRPKSATVVKHHKGAVDEFKSAITHRRVNANAFTYLSSQQGGEFLLFDNKSLKEGFTSDPATLTFVLD